MKQSVKSVVALFAICAVIAVLLASVNYLTKPYIDKNAAEATQKALSEVMPTGEDFQPVDLEGKGLPASVIEAYREKNGGIVVKIETSGYSSGMVILCGVLADGQVSGAVCLQSGETLGYEKTYGQSLIGATAGTIDRIDTVSGATKTTAGYRQAVKDALSAAALLSGTDGAGTTADTTANETTVATNTEGGAA